MSLSPVVANVPTQGAALCAFRVFELRTSGNIFAPELPAPAATNP